MPNIYLVGMMGSGKSITGKKLALKMGRIFVDLDDLIQEKTQRTINEIFEKEGEVFFRDLEAELLREVSASGQKIMATGGGTVLRPTNVERMKSTGKIIYLETSLSVLWSRVKDKKDRPLLKSGDPYETLSKIYHDRLPVYESVYDLKVSTDGKTAVLVADEIQKRLTRINV